MKRLIFIVLSFIFVFSQTLLFSQIVAPFKIDRNKRNNITELRQKNNVKLYQVLNTDLAIIQNLFQSSPNSIDLTIPIDARRQVILELEKVEIFSTDFQLKLASNNANAQVEMGVFYKGKIKGDQESLVSISIFKEELSGFISSSKENFSLGKLKGGNWRGEHVIYDDSFLFQDKQLECGTKDDGKSYNGKDLELTNDEALADKCVELYFEVDNDIYVHFGNVNATTTYITGLISQVIILYQNEGIHTQVSEIKIWDIQSPYSGNSSSAMLNSFKSNTGNFNGDLAQLLSFRASGGIAAGFSGLCNANPDNSKSFSSITSTYSNVPTYSWSVQLVTHEFGHLFGSRHTHACVWNGNNTAIDGCSGFTEGNCTVPGYPSQGGTIMSYCHFSGRPGINFNLGFGGQPGNIIRSNVVNASCATQCCPFTPDWCDTDYFIGRSQILGDGSGVHKYPALTGDFNGDGKADIAFIGQGWNGNGLNIRTKLSNGDGTYTAKSQILGDGSGVHKYPALTGDFNGDGRTDIAFVGQGWSGNGLNIRTKLSNGNGTYSAKSQILGDGSGVHKYPALTGDFNGDGKADIAFVGQNWTGCKNGLNIRIKHSLGTSWGADCEILGDGSGVHVYPALVGDFSGNNKVDIAFIGQNWSGTGLNVRTKESN